jgi:SAM-dependent methyltransferase
VALIGGTLGYRLLRRISPAGNAAAMDGSAYAGKSKLEVLLGQRVWNAIGGKTVLDFGCGAGHQAVELAQHGAGRVIGLDIRESALSVARANAREAGVADRCTFTTDAGQVQADVIISIDAFEHFSDPARVLQAMSGMLDPQGCVLASFGPTWHHPLGGHLFSVFPWAHLLFTERALIRWRSDFKHDGATRFSEVEGGLNQMTIRRFERLVAASPLRFAEMETVPIRRLGHTNRLMREWTTATVRCRLVRR